MRILTLVAFVVSLVNVMTDILRFGEGKSKNKKNKKNKK